MASEIRLPFADEDEAPTTAPARAATLPLPPRSRKEALEKAIETIKPARALSGGKGLASVDNTNGPGPAAPTPNVDPSDYRCPKSSEDPAVAEKMAEKVLGIRNISSLTFEKNLDVAERPGGVKSRITLSRRTVNERPALFVKYEGELKFSVQGAVCVSGNEIHAVATLFGKQYTIQLQPLRSIPNSIRIVTPLTPSGDVYTAR